MVDLIAYFFILIMCVGALIIGVISFVYGLYSFSQPGFDRDIQFFSLLIGTILIAGVVALYLSWH